MGTSLPGAGLALALGLVLAADSGAAQDTQLSPDSDGGGSSFSLSCGATRVLIGVHGGAGSWVDRVDAICIQVTSDGEWIGSETIVPSSGGGSGATFILKCPVDHAVNALSGRSGQWLDKLQVHCRPLGSNGRLSGSMILARTSDGAVAVGGSGGTTGFGPNACTGDTPARSLRGTAGGIPLGASAVNRIGLNCATPAPLALESLVVGAIGAGSPTSGTLRFTRAVPVAGETVALSSANPAIGRPSTTNESIQSGASSESFGMATVGSNGGCVTITGVYRGITRSDVLVVHPPPAAQSIGVLIDDAKLINGARTMLRITSTGAVTTATVTTSDAGVVTVPSTVTVPTPGSLRGQGEVPVTAVGPGCAVITVVTARGNIGRRTVYVRPIGGG